jgi:hypothetical protein
MTCAELREKVAGLVMMPPSDPERAAADEHTAGCAACSQALREAEQVLALLDSAPPLPAPSPAALERTAASIRAELAGGRAFPGWLVAALLALVAISALLVWRIAGGGGLEVGEGIECLAIELGGAALGFFAARGLKTSAAAVPLFAGAGAMAGQVVLVWRCPAHAPSHLLVFHLGGVLLALFAAAQLTRLIRRDGWSARRS